MEDKTYDLTYNTIEPSRNLKPMAETKTEGQCYATSKLSS